MTSNKDIDAKIFTYSSEMGREQFKRNTIQVGTQTRYQTIQPTVSFVIADIPSKAGLVAKAITRSGQMVYDTTGDGNGTTTGGNIPTVGGGNDLFITKTAGGINVAVAAPQQVRVLSSTGAVLYSGMVQTSVDVAIPTTGVYVVAGENEAQKILY